jgi:hypothetical protein
MRLDQEFHRYVAQGRYRPRRQWLNYPGSGTTIRPRLQPVRRGRFGWREIRILLIALVLGAIAWSQLASDSTRSAKPVAGARGAR